SQSSLTPLNRKALSPIPAPSWRASSHKFGVTAFPLAAMVASRERRGSMPKAYWIARVTVTDPDRYKLYADGAPLAFKKYGATALARGGRYSQMEGEGRPRNVVIEVP